MRRSILLVALSAVVLGGCTSAYKSGQTPDDVYYSPDRQKDEYVRVKEDDQPKYQSADEYYDDRYLRMKVHNRVMWSSLDDLNYYNRQYSYSYYNSINWNNPWSPYTYWNAFYNPYCSHQVVYGGNVKTAYSHPRMFNLNTYNNTQLTNNNYTNPKGIMSNNSKLLRVIGTDVNTHTNNSSNNAGSFLRNIFNGATNSFGNSSSGSGKSSSSSSPVRSSSSGSSGGGTAPVRKF